MIEARGLTRRFDDRVAVENVSLAVAPGEIFGLLGPNGAGKTTTLRMLGGLILPTSGEAHIAGLPLTREGIDRVRTRVGFLTEAPGLAPSAVGRLITTPMAPSSECSQISVTLRAKFASARFGIAIRKWLASESMSFMRNSIRQSGTGLKTPNFRC